MSKALEEVTGPALQMSGTHPRSSEAWGRNVPGRGLGEEVRDEKGAGL